MLNLIPRKVALGEFSNSFGGFIGSWNRVAPSSVWISKKGDHLGSFSSFNWRIINSPYSCFIGGGGISKISSRESPSVQKERTSSPWLTLPPVFDGGDMFYKFYSLAENEILSFKNQNRELELSAEDTTNLSFVGSSHGWLALFNKRNCDFFLYNPISGRHINLPSYNNLPFSENQKVKKVIISCSPDKEHCRAMVTYGAGNRLAFCCPGRSLEWVTPTEELLTCGCSNETIVYSSKQKLFFALPYDDLFEAWDLRDPQSWKTIPMNDVFVDAGKTFLACNPNNIGPIEAKSFLVIAEHSDELYLLRRFVRFKHINAELCADDIRSTHEEFNDITLYMTIGFDVHKYDPMNLEFKYMDPKCSSCMDGLAFFIGYNHGFALRADDFPELKPNSIYFTDTGWFDQTLYGGHDIGIYSYEDRIISSCYYPWDVRGLKEKLIPSPIWFFPYPL